MRRWRRRSCWIFVCSSLYRARIGDRAWLGRFGGRFRLIGRDVGSQCQSWDQRSWGIQNAEPKCVAIFEERYSLPDFVGKGEKGTIWHAR